MFAIVAASLLALISLGFLFGGGAAVVLDQTQRDSSGYLMTSTESYSTPTYALVSAGYRGGTANDWFVDRSLLGTVKLRVNSSRPVFIGIGPERVVDTYLAGVAHAQGDTFTSPSSDFRAYPGGAPSSPPGAQSFWSARATGTGQQTLTWTPRAGNWRIVVMNADAGAGVSSDVSIGARIPHLATIGIALLGAGILLMLLSGGGIYLATRRWRSTS